MFPKAAARLAPRSLRCTALPGICCCLKTVLSSTLYFSVEEHFFVLLYISAFLVMLEKENLFFLKIMGMQKCGLPVRGNT